MSELNSEKWEARLESAMAVLMDIATDSTLNDKEQHEVYGTLVRINAVNLILETYRATMYVQSMKDQKGGDPWSNLGGTQVKAFTLDELFGSTKPKRKNDDEKNGE